MLKFFLLSAWLFLAALCSPLFAAGDGGRRHVDIVSLLIKANADVNLADKDGVTPLQHARGRGFGEIAALLEKAGAK